MRLEHEVRPEEDGCRAVDVLLRQSGISRQMSKRIRLYGQLTCNGVFQRMIDPVHTGDCLVAVLPDQASAELNPDHAIDIVYEDDWLLVVDKPVGLVTHPKNLYEPDSLLTRLSSGHLHPVSRLDRDTSGLVLIGRNSHAHYRLSRTEIRKEYLAVVRGCPEPPDGTIRAPIARAPHSIIERMVSPDGDDAITHYRTLRHFAAADCSLLAVRLETGRTHQIRVHMRHIGHPLIGETLYRGVTPHPLDAHIGRQALHAWLLSFQHPISGVQLTLRRRPPADFVQLLLDCRNVSAARSSSPASDRA